MGQSHSQRDFRGSTKTTSGQADQQPADPRWLAAVLALCKRAVVLGSCRISLFGSLTADTHVTSGLKALAQPDVALRRL
jgi:hypothetical protein